MMRRLGMVFLAASVAGCTDLSQVRSFAATGSAISQNEQAISGWPGTYTKVASLAGSAPVKRHDPGARQAFLDKNKSLTAKATLADQSAKMLGLYLQALGDLAGGTVADVSKQAASIQSSVKTLGSADPKVEAATDALGLLLNTWQTAEVTGVIVRANPSVQVITAFLSSTADAVRISENEAMIATNQDWSYIGADSGNPDIGVFAQRAMDEDDADYQSLMAKAAAAKAAFAKIGADHAALAQNANSLSGARATLAADLPLLQDSLKIILK